MASPEEPGDVAPDLSERRPEILRRLVARGVAPRTLQTLFPGWDIAVGEGDTGRA